MQFDNTDMMDSINVNSDDNFDNSLDDNELFDDAELDFNDDELEDIDTNDIDVLTDDNKEVIDANAEIEDDNTEQTVNTADYMDGAIVNDDLTEDEDEEDISEISPDDFISESGDIVLQNIDDAQENAFSIEYIPIDKIAITQRIRHTKSVEGLTKSIKSTGLLEPLVVAPTLTDGFFVLLAGYRRLQACAHAGKERVPCVVNHSIKTNKIPIVEAMYNHSQKYTIKEQIDYINYLETQQGIMNPSMIEYILQMTPGDYTKLKDILADNDDDIVGKLYEGIYDISSAFKKLEQRRKKESKEEQENKIATQVYDNEEESGADTIRDSGEEVGNTKGPSSEIIEAVQRNSEEVENYLQDQDLDKMIKEDNALEGFEPHVQKTSEREIMDPAIKKAVMARDKATCRCCRSGGPSMVNVLDYHHTLPVFLGGSDSPDNGVMLCLTCHKMVHLYSTGDLTIDKDLYKKSYDELTEDEKANFCSRLQIPTEYTQEQRGALFSAETNKMKKIVYYGSIIRRAMSERKIDRQQYKKDHPNSNIGRRMPGVTEQQAT